MSVAPASQIQVRRIRESTPGTLPAGNMTIHNFETFQFNGTVEREQPGDVRADRQVTDNPATTINPSGSATNDFVYQGHDGLMEEVMCLAKASGATTTAATIAAVASGNKLTNSAGWASFAVGDIVRVTGFSTNPAHFLGLVSALSGNDLTLAWPTLQDESAGSSITVMFTGEFFQGTGILTAYYEEWNSVTSKGKSIGGVGVSQYQLTVPYPNKCQESWQLVGLANPARITSQLANASTAASTNGVINSNVMFGDGANPTRGYGLRYNGALLANLRLMRLQLTVGNPLFTEGGAGTFGPTDVGLDGRFDVRLELQFLNKGTDADTLIADANDATTVKPIGFGFVDEDGNHRYCYLAACQPSGNNTGGLSQQGSDTVTITYMARADSVHDMLHVVDFDA